MLALISTRRPRCEPAAVVVCFDIIGSATTEGFRISVICRRSPVRRPISVAQVGQVMADAAMTSRAEGPRRLRWVIKARARGGRAA